MPITISSCFIAPIALRIPVLSSLPNKRNYISRSAPTAILEEVRKTKPTKPDIPSKCPAHQSFSPQDSRTNLPPGVLPANYRVYADGFPEEQSSLPSPPIHYTLPMFGYALEIALLNILPRDRARKFGDLYTSSGFGRKLHVLADHNAICELLRDSQTFVSKDSSSVVLNMFGERSILNLDGKDHKETRGKFAAAFSPRLFGLYTERIRTRAENAWKKVTLDVSKDKKALLDDMIRELYLAVTIEMVNGTGMKPEEYSRLRILYRKLLDVVFTPQFLPGFKEGLKARDEILVIVGGIIKRMLVKDADVINELREFQDSISSKGSKEILKGRVSIAHIWAAKSGLNVGPGASNDPALIKELAFASLGFWFAGMSTSASTTSSAIFEMGLDQAIWNRLVEEQDKIIEKAGGSRTVQYDQMEDMVVLDSFIDEIMRLHPAVYMTVRNVARDCEVFGHKLKKGSGVFFDFFAANLDERYYPEPEKLLIDRFLPNNVTGVAAPKPLTFGVKRSAHYCLGAGLAKVVIKTTVSILLREYTLEMDENQSRKYQLIPDNSPADKVIVTALKPRSSDPFSC